MPTVIDALVVTLGLDPRQFTQGQQQAMESLKKMSDSAALYGQRIERSAKGMGEAFSVVKAGAVGVLGAFIGAEAAGFVEKVANMDAATGRLSKTIGVGVQTLSLWEGIVTRAGGSADEARSSFASLTDALAAYRVGAAMPPPAFVALAAAAGFQPGMDPDAIFRSLAAFVTAQRARGARIEDLRFLINQVPGMTPGMLNAVLGGTEGLRRLEEATRKFGLATADTAEQAIELQIKTENLNSSLRELARIGFPVIGWIADKLSFVLGAYAKVIGAAEERDIRGGSYSPLARGLTRFLIGPQTEAELFGPGAGTVPVKPGAGTATAATSAIMGILSRVAGVGRVTALEDAFHTRGAHAEGRAVDFTVTDPARAGEVAEAVRNALAAAGVDAKVIDEYAHPSPHATGGHIHVQVGAATAAALGAGGKARAGDVRNSSSSITFGTINVYSAKADPKDVALEIPDAVQQRMIQGIPVNGGNF